MEEFEACDLDGDIGCAASGCYNQPLPCGVNSGCVFVVIGPNLKADQNLMSAINSLHRPVQFAESIESHLPAAIAAPSPPSTVYVTDQFDFERHCALFKRLASSAAASAAPSCCVLGPPALAQLLLQPAPPPPPPERPRRPVYAFAMRGVVACLTGFSEKSRVSRIAFLVHCLGGGIRAEVTRKVTHLIAVSTADAKYRKAVTYGIPVMTADWVEAAWAARDRPGVDATAGQLFTSHRLRPFVGNTLAFYGYPEAEAAEMSQLTLEAGGAVAAPESPTVTQLVVNSDLLDAGALPAGLAAPAVRSEWFWLAIQNGYQFTASLYALHQSPDPSAAAAGGGLGGGGGGGGVGSGRKRRRLAHHPLESLAGPPDAAELRCLAAAAAGVLPSPLRLSGVSSAASVLDATADSSCAALSPVAESGGGGSSSGAIGRRRRTPDRSASASSTVAAPAAASEQSRQQRRLQTATELAQTEANYVSILGVIVNVIRREVADPGRPGGALLPDMAAEIIFHGLEPIYRLHCGIEEALRRLTENWSDDCLVGKVFTDRADQLCQVYPPFVNFLEQAKEEMARWEQRDPRFRAYLRLCLSRKECLRQSLKELLIRPVQRLPSVTLLLGDLLKATPEDSPDHACLQTALAAVRQALDHINEEKRATDSQLAMFDIINDIENCPPSLLSSHRAVVDRVEAIELANGSSGYRPLAGAGSYLSLLLFSDFLQISKLRKSSGAAAGGGGGNGNSGAAKASSSALRPPKRQYRHLELLHLSQIRRVCSLTDERDPADARRLFGLLCRSAESGELFVLAFALCGSADKPAFLRAVCAQICAATCSAESLDSFYARVDVDALRVDTAGVFDRQHGQQLSARARRFGKRVTRALSNRTPRRTLTRTVSVAAQQQQQAAADGSPASVAAAADSDAGEDDNDASFASAGGAAACAGVEAKKAGRDDLSKSSSSSRLSIAGLSAKRLRKQLSSWSLSRGK